MFDFDSVQTALERLGATCDAAESQGTLCALLIDNAGFAAWMSHTLEELPERSNVLATEQLAVLEHLFEQTRQQMNDEDLALELLLPDDVDDFGLRLLGLAGWCQGFLYGIGVGEAAVEDSLDEESRECLSDLLEISKLSYDEEPSEDAELQFAEIVEHVRVSVIILNESLNPLKPAATLH